MTQGQSTTNFLIVTMATSKEMALHKTMDKQYLKDSSKVQLQRDSSRKKEKKGSFAKQKEKKDSSIKEKMPAFNARSRRRTSKHKVLDKTTKDSVQENVEIAKNDFNHNSMSINRNDVLVQYDDESPPFIRITNDSKIQRKPCTSKQNMETAKPEIVRDKDCAVIDTSSEENAELSKVVWKDTSPRLTPKTLESLNGEQPSDNIDGNSKYVDLWLDIMREYVCLWKDIEDREQTDVSDLETPIIPQTGENKEPINGATDLNLGGHINVKMDKTCKNEEEMGITYTDLGEVSNENPECYDNWDINDFTLIPEESDDGTTDNPVQPEQPNRSQIEANYQKEIPFIVKHQHNDRTKLISKDINGVYNPQKSLHEKLQKSYVAKTCVDSAKKLHRENMLRHKDKNNDTHESELSNSPQSDIDSVYAWTLNGTEFASDNEDIYQQTQNKIPTINEEDIIYESAIINGTQQKTSSKHFKKKLRKKLTLPGQNQFFNKQLGNSKKNKTASKSCSSSDPPKVHVEKSHSNCDQNTQVRPQSTDIQKQHTDNYQGNRKPESSKRWKHQSKTSNQHYISESEATVYEFDKVIQGRRAKENKDVITPLKNPILLNGGGKYYIMVPRPIESLNLLSDDSESEHSYDSQCEACINGEQHTFSDNESVDSFDSQCEACIENHSPSLVGPSNTEKNQEFLPNQQNLLCIHPEEAKLISSPRSMTSPRSMGSTPRSKTSSHMSLTSTPRSLTLTPRSLSTPESYYKNGYQGHKVTGNPQQLHSAYSSSPSSRLSVPASQQSEIESDYGTESEHTVAYAIGPIHSIRSAHMDFHNDCDSGISSVSLNSSKSKHSSAAGVQSMLWESLNGGIRNKLKLRNSAYLQQPNGNVEYKVSKKFLNHYTCEIKQANEGHLRVTKV